MEERLRCLVQIGAEQKGVRKKNVAFGFVLFAQRGSRIQEGTKREGENGKEDCLSSLKWME